MNKVITPDGQAITITGDYDYVKIRSCQLEARGKCQRSPMGRVKSIGIDVRAQPARATDAADHRQLVFLDIQPVNSPQQSPQRDTVAATRAQKMGK